MKRGLIMEGGAMRGMFTCGVIDVFMENGITFDGAVGISAGAAFGCNIKSRQIGRAIRYNKKYCRDPRFGSFRSFITTGDLYGAEFCYDTLPRKLDPFDSKAFRENPMAFYIGASDARSGEMVFHECGDGEDTDIQWMRASASMPLVSRTVHLEGREYLDGGILCPVPYAVMEEKGYDRNVIVLTQPKGYRKKKGLLSPLISAMLFRYPAMAKAMGERHTVYNRQMEEIDAMEAAGKVLVIRPRADLGIGKTENNPDELERVYQQGRSETLTRLEEVRSFLKE